jgi:hypothetical protein
MTAQALKLGREEEKHTDFYFSSAVLKSVFSTLHYTFNKIYFTHDLQSKYDWAGYCCGNGLYLLAKHEVATRNVPINPLKPKLV